MSFRQMVKGLAFASALGLSMGSLSHNATADGHGYAGNVTYPIAVFGGAEFAKDSHEFYSGGVLALNGDLDKNGFVFRLLGSRGWFEDYNGTDDIDGDYWQGDAMVGYQIVSRGVTVGAYIGVDIQDYDLSPDDPYSAVRGSETGFKVALDIATERYSKKRYYGALRGSYSTAFDTYYALARVGINVGRIAIGPEGWLLGDDSGDAQRIGGFILTDISLGGHTAGTFSVSGGYQFVDNADDPWGRNFGEEGAYGTIKYTMAFGRARSHEPLK